MSKCLFCKIAVGKIPSYKIWEDKNTLAILDINPNCEGQSLIISKKHFPADIFEITANQYLEIMKAAKKVTRLLKRALKVKRVAMILEGMGVNHAHLKLYPLWGLENEFGAGESPKKVYFKKYPGFVTSQLGPRADFKKLEKLALKIGSGK